MEDNPDDLFSVAMLIDELKVRLEAPFDEPFELRVGVLERAPRQTGGARVERFFLPLLGCCIGVKWKAIL